MAKKLQDNSQYNQYDTDGDGIVSDEEIARAERLAELENKDQKEDQLRQMAWVAMLSMVFFTIALFLPFLSVERLTALDNLLSMFYIAQAGVVATFFGSSAYMSRS
jgi:hypothetical protein